MTIKTVSDVPDDFTLLQDSQDIRACLESIGRLDMMGDTGHLFVKTGDGEYADVYYSEVFTPRLDEQLYRLTPGIYK